MKIDPEIKKILENHEKRISILEGRKTAKTDNGVKTWYKKGSTIERIVLFINEGFFSESRSMSNIISELKTKDYHLKSSDLTLPLRKIVRKGLLKRTKKTDDGSPSKNWLYKIV